MQPIEVDPEDPTSHLGTWTGPDGRLMTRLAGQAVHVADLLRSRQAARADRDRERSTEMDIRASVVSTARALAVEDLVEDVLSPAAPWKLERDPGGRLVVKDRETGGPMRDRDGRAVISLRRLLETLRDQDPELLAQADVQTRIAHGLRSPSPAARPIGEAALAARLTPEEKCSIAFRPGPPRPGLRTRRCDETTTKVSGGMQR